MDNLLHNLAIVPACELKSDIKLIPSSSGIYFLCCQENAIEGVPYDKCLSIGDWVLIHVDTSPQEKPKGAIVREGNIRKRINSDIRSDAGKSAFRLLLGLTLSDELQLTLKKQSASKNTFGDGEHKLSDWIEVNLAIAYFETSEPWNAIGECLDSYYFPFFTKIKTPDIFQSQLRDMRSEAILDAKNNAK